MGATSWRYYTPYRASPEEALQRLREQVFARGEYVDPTGSMEDRLRGMYQRFGEDPDSPAVQGRIAESLRLQRAVETGEVGGLTRGDRAFARRVRWFTWFSRLLGAAPPRNGGRRASSIEELLELAEENGTHSVLDIEHVGKRPEPGVASPLSSEELQEAFETAQPTHAQVEDRWADIAEGLGLTECCYLTVFLDGQPHEYAFIGCSGD